MATTPKQIFVILCGGTGPRLWPLSTTSHPKQLLPILSDVSLLEQTIVRLTKVTQAENIYIVTSNKNIDSIQNIAKKHISLNNIFIEPDKKNTAIAIFYTLTQLSSLDNNDVVTFLPSDHYISPINKFKSDLQKAGILAYENSSIVTIGIHPTFPNPSFGYILKNNKFIEKPNKIQALKYIINSALWNSGIYTATIKTYLCEFDKYFPKPNYKNSKPISFDYAISQKSNKIEHFKASFDWSDIGEWGSILALSKQDKQHNASVNKNTKYITYDSQHCLLSSQDPNKLIGVVGLNNISIIDTPNALLVTSNEKCSHVRDLVTLIVGNPKLKNYFVDNES